MLLILAAWQHLQSIQPPIQAWIPSKLAQEFEKVRMF
jgi:hypothetical protein